MPHNVRPVSNQVKYYYMLQVKLNFLMKGNTHEDVDQLFSRFGNKLSTNNVV